MEGGGGGGGGGVEDGFSCNNFLMKKDIDMKFWLIVNGLTKKLADFCKIKHCPYLSEGEGSILYITGIKAFLHEADDAYSIRSTWSCYWLDQFLTLALVH